jgi:hypothetical protein
MMHLIVIVVSMYTFTAFSKLHTIKVYNRADNLSIKMNYDPLKGYTEKLTIIPSFQTNIIINNWMNSLSTIRNVENPKYIFQSIYDMKIFVSINREDKSTVLLAWCPDVSQYNSNVGYLIGGKVINDELHICRIAQSPYYEDLLGIDSNNLVKDITQLVINSPTIHNVNYTKLHNYDSRYLLSWNFFTQSDDF